MEKVKFSFGEDKVAYIWPDLPFVVAGTIILEDVIREIEEGSKVEDISKSISKKYGEDYNETYEFVCNLNEKLEIVNNSKEKSIEYPSVEISMATFNMTKLCNLSCKHCYASAGKKPPKKELGMEDIDVVLKKLSTIVTHAPKLLILSGGEPTLEMNKLIYTIKRAYEYGFNIRINSNGMIMTDELLETIKSCNVLLQISIDGANKKSHALLRGSEESYDRARETVRSLSSKGCRIRVSMTTHKDNYLDIPEAFQNAIEDNAEQFITSNLVITGEAKRNGLKPVTIKNEFEVLYECVKDDKKLQWMTKSTLLAETINAMRAGVKFLNCGTGICTCCVDSDGGIYPCINMVNDEYKIANLLEDEDLCDVWNNSIIIEKLRKISVDGINDTCSNCVFRYFCGAYCRGETLSGGGTLQDPYIRCTEWKQALIYVLKILCETPDLYYFNRDSEMEMMERE